MGTDQQRSTEDNHISRWPQIQSETGTSKDFDFLKLLCPDSDLVMA